MTAVVIHSSPVYLPYVTLRCFYAFHRSEQMVLAGECHSAHISIRLSRPRHGFTRQVSGFTLHVAARTLYLERETAWR